ncbi:hypothetical protein ACGFW5_11605 [Streptomyces sp. NPDC048416]|uniref:hypothetical protein n=1 Tax=Streptomyces sp. NPDC048416 TaxID=3365546 RepID=UPI00371AF349
MVRDRDAFTKAEGQDPAPGSPAAPAPPASAAGPARHEKGGDSLGATTVLPTAGPPAAGHVPAGAATTGAASGPGAPADEQTNTSRWLEVPWLTLLLAVAIVAALAFIAGVLVERH